MANEPVQGRPTPRGADLYAALCEQFETHFELPPRGGGSKALTYVTVEQVISRANAVLGIYGWQLLVDRWELININGEPYEFVASGRVGVWDETLQRFDEHGNLVGTGDWVWRSQAGSQQVKWFTNKQGQHVPVDLGFDLKGAISDLLKKALTLFGVALYLSDKEDPVVLEGTIVGPQGQRRQVAGANRQTNQNQNVREPGGTGSRPAPTPINGTAAASSPPPPNGSSRLRPPTAVASTSTSTASTPATSGVQPGSTNGAAPALRTDNQHCAYCGNPIVDYTRKDNSVTKAVDQIRFSTQKFGAPLCIGDYVGMRDGELSTNRADWPAQQVQVNGQPMTESKKTPLEGLQTFLTRLVEQDFSAGKGIDADAEELDAAVRLLWEAVGEEQVDAFLTAIFGPSMSPLSRAEAQAIVKWTETDKQWKDRAQQALAGYLNAPAAAA